MRSAAVVLVWTVAAVVVLASVGSAFVGRADFGDGEGASLSVAAVIGLLALACAAVAVAVWVTRALRRGT